MKVMIKDLSLINQPMFNIKNPTKLDRTKIKWK